MFELWLAGLLVWLSPVWVGIPVMLWRRLKFVLKP